MKDLGAAIMRRRSKTLQVLDLFRSKPGQWINVHELAKVGGFAAWRSRVADSRKLAEKDGELIEWNGKEADSAYRLRPAPLGRDAGEFVERRWNETGAFQDDGFKLRP